MADVEAGYNEVRANKARQAERRLIGRLDGGGGVCALPARRHCPGGRRAAEPPLRRTKASNYGQQAATRATQWHRSRGEIESPAPPSQLSTALCPLPSLSTSLLPSSILPITRPADRGPTLIVNS